MTNRIANGRADFAEFALFARELALAARRETLRYLSRDIAVTDKGHDSLFDPVTDADRAAEIAMRRFISERFPDHGVVGEECAEKAASSHFTWSLDPIDGTRSYMCGLPTWTTLIALLQDDDPVLGLIDAPRLDEIYIGDGDEVAMIQNGEKSRLSTSGCTRIAEVRFSTTDPFLFGHTASALQPILRTVRVTRYGHDGYAYARLAAGDIDLVIECSLKPHDYTALIPVVRGAGGHFGDWHGGSDFGAGNVIAAATRDLYDAAVELLASE